MPNSAFNPLDKDTRFSLSGGNLVATAASAATQVGACIADGKTAGKYYIEITVGGTTAGNTCIGVYTLSPSWLNAIANDLRGAYCYANSSIFYNGSSSGFTLGGFASGNVVCVALDLDNAKVWFRKGSGNWNGNASHNPATNTGGISLSTLVAAGRRWFLMVGAGTSTAPVFTLNAGDSAFSQAVPSGFTAGWPDNGATASGSVFNTATATAGLTFANGNLTVAAAAPVGKQHGRTNGGASTGKFYWETYINSLPAAGAIGVANSNTLGDSFYDSAINGAVLYPSGQLFVNGSSVLAANAATAYTAGQTVCVALDLDNARLWVRTSEGNWLNDAAANPATNTNGKDIAGITGSAIFPAVCCASGTSFTFSVNTTDYGKLVPPAGFIVGPPPPSAAAPLRNRRLMLVA